MTALPAGKRCSGRVWIGDRERYKPIARKSNRNINEIPVTGPERSGGGHNWTDLRRVVPVGLCLTPGRIGNGVKIESHRIAGLGVKPERGGRRDTNTLYIEL